MFDELPADGSGPETPDTALPSSDEPCSEEACLDELLAEAPNGYPTLDLLRGLDFDGLSKDELLEVISALDRVTSWVTAQSHDAVLAYAGETSTRPVPTPDPGTPAGRYSLWDQGWETEILAERLRLSYPTVQARIAHARVLHASLPLTLAGLRDGSLTPYQSVLLLHGTAELAPQERTLIEAEVLPEHAEDNPTQLKTAISRAIRRAFPDRAKKKTRDKHLDRGVIYKDLPDDQAMLYAVGPAVPLRYVYNQLDAAARVDVTALPPPIDTSDLPDPARWAVEDERAREEYAHGRSLARRRHDLLLDCLLDSAPAPNTGTCPGDTGTTTDTADETAGEGEVIGALREGVLRRLPMVPVELQIVITEGSLLGATEEPAHLPGHGPLNPATIRELVAAQPETYTTMRRMITDDRTGRLLDRHPDRYQMEPNLRQFIRDQDRYCARPGCTRSSQHAEIDHTVEFPLGKTVRANLRARCTRDHLYKTFGPNTTHAEPDGTVVTTSPTARWSRRARPANRPDHRSHPSSTSEDATSAAPASSPRRSLRWSSHPVQKLRDPQNPIGATLRSRTWRYGDRVNPVKRSGGNRHGLVRSPLHLRIGGRWGARV